MATQINKENMRKWVAALRSGEFRQTRSRLGDATGYCCLGVACEIAIREGVKLFRQTLTTTGAIIYDGSGEELPDAATEWLGLTSPGDDLIHDANPDLSNGEIILDAATWNDEYGATFAQIADMIERTYLATNP